MTVHLPVAFKTATRTIQFTLLIDPDFPADAQLYKAAQAEGMVEVASIRLMARALSPGDFAVDAGANIGFFTCLFVALVGPTGKVLACEPGSANVKKLCDNLFHNKFDNVDIAVNPLWNIIEQREFHIREDSGLNSLAKSDDALSSARLMTTTFDSKSKKYPIPRLIKLDCEGAEEMILRGGANSWVGKTPYIITEFNLPGLANHDCSQESFRAFMYEHGYEMFFLSHQGAMPTLVPHITKIQSNIMNLNVLFSSPESVGILYPEVVFEGYPDYFLTRYPHPGEIT